MIDIKKELHSRFVFLCITVAISAVFLSYFKYQSDYDRFHTKSERIYKLVTTLNAPGEHLKSSISPYGLAPRIDSSIDLVEKTARISYSKFQLRAKSADFYAADGLFADGSVFEIFDFPLLSGNLKSALQKPFSVVLTQKTAVELFGETQPLGQLLYFENSNQPATVTAVVENLPANSQIKTSLFVSISTLTQMLDADSSTTKQNVSVITYLLLKANTSKLAAQQALYQLQAGANTEAFRNMTTRTQLGLEPFRGGYLNPSLSRFALFALYAALIVIALLLLESVNSLVKIVLLQISLSDDYQTINSDNRNKRLLWRVCSLVLAANALSGLLSLGIIGALDYFFEIKIMQDFNAHLRIVASLLILSIVSSILISLWVALRVPTEPIRTYLLNKKS